MAANNSPIIVVEINAAAEKLTIMNAPGASVQKARAKDFPLPGDKLRGNFYKCGEKAPQPHWGSWTKLSGDTPQRHQPASFGDLEIDTTRL